MFILYWIFFVLLLISYSRILFPLLESILEVLFSPDLAQGISFFIVFIISVITLAKFLQGDFHLFFSRLFSKSKNKEVNQNQINRKNYFKKNNDEEIKIFYRDKYYQEKKNAGYFDDNDDKSSDVSFSDYIFKFLGLFFLFFLLVILIVGIGT